MFQWISLLIYPTAHHLNRGRLGTNNNNYCYGIQTILASPTMDLDEEVVGLLGSPSSIRLTSLPTRHFVDVYFQ